MRRGRHGGKRAESTSESPGKSGTLPRPAMPPPSGPSRNTCRCSTACLTRRESAASAELTSVRAQGGAGGTHQARLERDVSAAEHGEAPRAAQPDRARPVLRPHRRRKARHPLHRPDRPARRRLRAEADRLARARRAALLRRDAAQPGRPGPPPPHLHQAARTVTGVDDEVFDLDKLSDKDRQHAVRRGGADRRGVAARAPAGWPTWSPPSRPSRTG